jgi:integrase
VIHLDKKHSPKIRGNGQGTVYKLPNGKWRAEVTIDWREIDGKKKRIYKTRSGFKLKRDALAAIQEMKQGTIGVNKQIKFNELYDRWSVSHFKNISKDMEYNYTAAYRRCSDLHHIPFSDIKTQDWQKIVDNSKTEAGTALSRRTKRAIRDLGMGMYKYAIENDYCDKNYAQFIKLPPKEQSKKDAFSSAEIKKLWKAYEEGDDFVSHILIMIYTGMRFGEYSGIVKDNINLAERYMTGGIKSEAGRARLIPIANKIYPIIEKMYNDSSSKLLTMHEKVFYHCFRDSLSKAEVRQLNPHCCRHTCATALAEANVPPAIIQAVLGHADYSTTMQYTHVQNLKNILNAINSIE